jgi:hypothetical protein
MKLFTRRINSEQQKADDAVQLKLIQVWVIMIITSAIPLTVYGLLLGKFHNHGLLIEEVLSLVTLNLIILVPKILRFTWKKLLPRVIVSSLWVGIVFLVSDLVSSKF